MSHPHCSICHDFGYVQVYQCARVIRVYCICPVGDKRVEDIKRVLEESGLDSNNPAYEFNRYTPTSYK